MNITDDQLETLRSQLATCKLGHGLGTVDEPCSVAAINLALSGELSDRDPSECMSPVIRRWVISVQDSMPVQMMAAGDEHGDRWRQALVGLAGTRDTKSEAARVAMIIDWMWECLATDWQKWVPTSAHSAWNEMLHEKTARAAYAAATAARAAYAAYAADAARAADAAARAYAADADARAYAAATAAYAADAATAAYAAHATADAAYAAYAAARAYAAATAADAARSWVKFDPASLLVRLTSTTAG